MGMADSCARDSVLCSYFQTARGRTTSAALRDRMHAAVEGEPLRSLVRTHALAHQLRRCLEDEKTFVQAKLL
jgi:hypothetical protein